MFLQKTLGEKLKWKDYMIIEILNWNTALTEDEKNLVDILEYVKCFLNKSNSIAVLQQIPRKDPKKNWSEHGVYRKVKEFFSEKEGYSMFENDKYNDGYIFMETVIISQMKGLKPANESYYLNTQPTNREVAVVVNNEEVEIAILGLHAKNGAENNNYLKSIPNCAEIIVGDFNAGNYIGSENMKTFTSILQSHVCICNLPTKVILDVTGKIKRKSCIDHIFVKREYVPKCSNMIVHENVRYSDHYPISFSLDI